MVTGLSNQRNTTKAKKLAATPTTHKIGEVTPKKYAAV
jgi:hypothetical protein